VTVLALRHHLSDVRLRDAVLGAPWADAAGICLDVAPLLDAAPVTADVVLVLADGAHGSSIDDLAAAVTALAATSTVLLAGPTAAALPELAGRAGVTVAELTGTHEVRVRPTAGVDPRRVEPLLVHDRVLLVDGVADGVEVLATASVAYRDHPVAAVMPAERLGVLSVGTTPQAWRSADLVRLVAHLAWHVTGRRDAADVRVGMLGYGAIGHEHALAVAAVPGLTMTAVADLDPRRLDAARQVAPQVRAGTDPEALLDDDELDLVVVSTPPNTHASWALRLLAAGKSVVLEKPMALTSAECDAVVTAAAEAGLLAVVYQNRRFDPDYRALRAAVRAGRVGDVFHLESFVGGFGHPCNYWHSDAEVSGGAIFDWGSHYLDQILDLMPGEVRHVTAAAHKRRWLDVTNADHARVTLAFTDGAEAEFVHSDLAAASKPKWLVLGTEGALVGSWRTERVVGRTAIGTLDEQVLAPADSPADLTLHGGDGSVTRLAVPPAPPQAFHRELADHLLRGLPMSVRAEHSRRVVAVMEAAEQSARRHGMPVPLS
jgi:predicted dehydrogenase